MKRALVFLMIVALALTSFAFPAPARADGDAAVYVIHGIPGQDLGLDPALPVDVLVNDALCALSDFRFGQTAGLLALPAGTYNIKISLANAADPCSNGAVIDADVPFAAGENATVIAHLTAGGAPTASKFVNDVSALNPGTGRVIVRHTAAAPMVDIKIEFSRKFNPLVTMIEGLSNPEQAGPLAVRPGLYDVTIFPAGSDQPVAGPVRIGVKPFTAYAYYAVGSLDTGSFTLLAQTFNLRPGLAISARR
jgi:hypothetical protein